MNSNRVKISRYKFSGRIPVMVLSGLLVYGSISAMVNQYPTVLLPLFFILLLPLFFIKRTVTISHNDKNGEVSIKQCDSCWKKKFNEVNKIFTYKDLTLVEDSHVGRRFYVLVGPEFQMPLYGLKGKEYECFRAMFI
ncbi:hypothetical protein OH460_09225 [Vibrio sp. Makdt]|uniref:hypothetical protein n=1 Tax=Vibrio sp. Makdt TaxID=2998828 RepID=UPI0022CD25A6|nr:hypothetical protein [Vibrio sp. Makdt]MDA0152484.1 hypothetical protein [Vibrio sp. Makdt]